MAASSRPDRRRRVERGIYQQPNGRYAVCVMVDGQPRFRTLSAATIGEARRQRELLQSIAQVGELPVSPQLTFAEVSARWLADFEANVTAGKRCDRTLDLYRSQLHRHLLPRLGPAGADHNRRRRPSLARPARRGSLTLDDQADPRRAQLRLYVRGPPRIHSGASGPSAGAGRAAASAPQRAARAHSDRARPPPARARPPRPAATPHRAEDTRLRSRDPAPPPARSRAATAQARLALHRQHRLRVRDERRHTVPAPQRLEARAPPCRHRGRP
jgi:hypothetical protein